MSIRRVVITGIGLVTPLGPNVSTSWNALVEGESGIKPIRKFDVTNFACKIAGIVDGGFNPENFINPRDIRKMDLFIQYGIAASTEAIDDSGWQPKDDFLLDRTGLILGSGIGGLGMIESTSVKLHKMIKESLGKCQQEEGDNIRVNPFFIPSSLVNLLSGHVSIKYGFTGPNHAVATACSTGSHAIGDAMRIIQYGSADVMIAGGAEAPITPVGVAGFISAKALSTKYNDNPEIASRPWDQDRDGFIMGEGSGVVVLEEYEHAIKRNAKIYVELVGYGSTGDAYHITSPHPEGKGAYKAMLNALKDAKIDASSVDYINAHGTSTKVGDVLELLSVQKLFLNANPKILMSSTKSSTGHLLGATGSVELIFSILAIQDQIAPPTLNLHNPIEEAKIDLVALESRKAKINYVLSNSFGFGGTNASLIIKKL